MVTHKERLKNIDGDFLIAECQKGERSSTCARVSDKLVLSHKGSVKDHDDDALPKWGMRHTGNGTTQSYYYIRRSANRLGTPQIAAWRTAHGLWLYPFHNNMS
jgi:hypothetical protein